MNRIRLTVAGLTILASCIPGYTTLQAGVRPFVAAFERFGRHDEINKEVSTRLLVTELSCTACHPGKSSRMPARRGPNLDGAGNRLRHEWIVRYLMSPHSMKPGTTMPDVLASVPPEKRQENAEAIAAFLESLTEPFPEIKGNGATPVPHEFWNQGSPQSGRRLFHQIGCVSCHEPDADFATVATKPTALDAVFEQLEPDEIEELGLASAARRVESVPLGRPGLKYSRKSLTHFLLNPTLNRPSGRMPNFNLGVIEAADIAAWLIDEADRGSAPDEKAAHNHARTGFNAVDRGRELFSKLGCANCHSADGIKSVVEARPLSELDSESSRSCIADNSTAFVNYSLDDAQKKSLIRILGRRPDDHSLSGNDRLLQRLLTLNCHACHERDRLGGIGRYRKAYFETVGHVDIGDEGRLPPPLTGAGRKLTQRAFQNVLAGKLRIRPHMRIRMPVFSSDQLKDLPALFASVDLEEQLKAEKNVFGAAGDLAEDGRKLLDVGCVQCHPLKGDALPGVVGTDLEGIASRVNPGWFREFLLDPGSLKSRTRMPTFFPAGKSQNQAVLNGDPEKQIAAMWFYLKDLNRQPLPAKLEKARNQSYELVPKERPVVLRTFMKDAGTHAIAVGFPEKVNFAFDAETVRPAIAWRGRFLDAQGTWFVRFAPPAEPLGRDLIQLPSGAPFAILDPEETTRPDDKGIPSESGFAYEFRGFRLDKQDVPTFLYRFGRFDIEDQLKPGEGQSIVRRLTLVDRTPSEKPVSLWMRGHAGESLKHNGLLSYTSASGLTVRVGGDVGHAGELRRRSEVGTEWLIPLEVKTHRTIEIRYEW